MTLQNDFYAARHRRKQIRQVPLPTATIPRVPVLPKPTVVAPTVVRPPVVKPTVTRVPKPPPVKPTVVPPLTPALPPVIPPVLSTPVASVAPVTPPLIATSSLPLPTTSSTVIPTTSSAPRITSTHTTSSASATPTVSPQPAGGVSTGAVVGGITGGFAVLGLIAAAVFLFLRRAREKKKKGAEVFDASKFRQSAVILEDPAEKHRRPRPPTMIEQHVQNTPTPRSNRSAPPDGGRYGEQAHRGAPYPGQGAYGAPYPGPYDHQAQAPYDQYSTAPSAYGYGHPHAYPPQPHYPLQPHYGPQHHGTYPHPAPPSVQIPDNPTSGRDDMALPNPFASSPSPVSDAAGPTQRSFVTTPNHAHSDSGSAAPNSTGNDEAPPAYEAAGKFAGYKPDVKVKPVLLMANPTGGSSSAPAATSSTSTASMRTLAPSARPAGGTLPERPLSSTSALTTIYDMGDAYGGI